MPIQIERILFTRAAISGLQLHRACLNKYGDPNLKSLCLPLRVNKTIGFALPVTSPVLCSLTAED